MENITVQEMEARMLQHGFTQEEVDIMGEEAGKRAELYWPMLEAHRQRFITQMKILLIFLLPVLVLGFFSIRELFAYCAAYLLLVIIVTSSLPPRVGYKCWRFINRTSNHRED